MYVVDFICCVCTVHLHLLCERFNRLLLLLLHSHVASRIPFTSYSIFACSRRHNKISFILQKVPLLPAYTMPIWPRSSYPSLAVSLATSLRPFPACQLLPQLSCIVSLYIVHCDFRFDFVLFSLRRVCVCVRVHVYFLLFSYLQHTRIAEAHRIILLEINFQYFYLVCHVRDAGDVCVCVWVPCQPVVG